MRVKKSSDPCAYVFANIKVGEVFGYGISSYIKTHYARGVNLETGIVAEFCSNTYVEYFPNAEVVLVPKAAK